MNAILKYGQAFSCRSVTEPPKSLGPKQGGGIQRRTGADVAKSNLVSQIGPFVTQFSSSPSTRKCALW